jgi:hypothetical protein
MLNKNYERTEVLAYILSKYSKKHIRDWITILACIQYIRLNKTKED